MLIVTRSPTLTEKEMTMMITRLMMTNSKEAMVTRTRMVLSHQMEISIMGILIGMSIEVIL